MAKIEKILFIDDDNVSSFLNETIVEELRITKQIISLRNAPEALAYIVQHYSSESSPSKRTIPDLIFLDIKMPGMDGFKFLQELEKLEGIDRSCFLVILLTASEDIHDQEKVGCFKDKVFACLSKPLAKEDLKKLLAEVLIEVN